MSAISAPGPQAGSTTPPSATAPPSLRSRLLGATSSPQLHRATTLELFFDLVYVLAFLRITDLMAQGTGVLGVWRGLVVLGILWWSWTSHAWLANHRRADAGIVRIGMVAAIALVFVLALAIPQTYGAPCGGRAAAWVFAVGFVVLSLVYTVVSVSAAGQDRPLRRQVLRTMSAAVVPVSLALITGAATGGATQLAAWSTAVLLYGAAVLWTCRGGQWPLPSIAHYAERHGLVVLLALGESITSIGTGVGQRPLTPSVVAGSLCGVALALGMWWTYFHRLAPEAEQALARRTGARRVLAAAEGTYLHLGIVAGVLLVALGTEAAMLRVGVPGVLGVRGGCALGGGLCLYLLATAVYRGRATGRWGVSRFAAASLAAFVIPALGALPGLTALALTSTLVITLAGAEHARPSPSMPTGAALVAPGHPAERVEVGGGQPAGPAGPRPVPVRAGSPGG